MRLGCLSTICMSIRVTSSGKVLLYAMTEAQPTRERKQIVIEKRRGW